jgi:hypothetical protein
VARAGSPSRPSAAWQGAHAPVVDGSGRVHEAFTVGIDPGRTGLGGGGCPHDVPELLGHLAGGSGGVVRHLEEVAKVGDDTARTGPNDDDRRWRSIYGAPTLARSCGR